MGYGNKSILSFYLLWKWTLWISIYGTQSCLCFSAIIFFFVKSDVQKCTSTESMPLLIDDRVGLLGLFLIKSYYDCLCRIMFCVLCLGYTNLCWDFVHACIHTSVFRGWIQTAQTPVIHGWTQFYQRAREYCKYL